MINRSGNTYVALPEHMWEKRIKEAKGALSISIVIPSKYEKKAKKFMDKQDKEFSKAFSKFIKKLGEDDDDDD